MINYKNKGGAEMEKKIELIENQLIELQKEIGDLRTVVIALISRKVKNEEKK